MMPDHCCAFIIAGPVGAGVIFAVRVGHASLLGPGEDVVHERPLTDTVQFITGL